MFQKIIFKNSTHFKKIPYRHLLKKKRGRRHLTSLPLQNELISTHAAFDLIKPITIRKMTIDDLYMVMDWTKEEKWNPGRHEEEALYAADPKGYFMLEVDGKPAVSLAAMKYSEKMAFLGLFIVKPEYRGQGYGAILWDIAMNRIKGCSSIGLNGVVAQVERYKKSGFEPNLINTRWKGKPINIPGETNEEKLTLNNEKVSLIDVDKFSLDQLISYDYGIFATPRKAFLSQWLKMPESRTLVALDKENNPCGYAVINRAEEGYKVAPLFANNEAIAKHLYRSLTSFISVNNDICIDTCEATPYASALMENFKLEKIFDTVQMFKGNPRDEIDYGKMLGLTSLHIF